MMPLARQGLYISQITGPLMQITANRLFVPLLIPRATVDSTTPITAAAIIQNVKIWHTTSRSSISFYICSVQLCLRCKRADVCVIWSY